jgi:predicted ATPase
MHRYVLTGAPGAGKTAIIRQLECDGHSVVEEAATDVIALEQALGRTEPEHEQEFIGKILALQRQRELRAARPGTAPAGGAVFFDRSPVCTLALSRYLGLPDAPRLAAEVDRVLRERVYARTVFFVRNRGEVVPTAARRISLADSLIFEKVHEQVYAELGFDLIDVPAGPLASRVALIRATVAARAC